MKKFYTAICVLVIAIALFPIDVSGQAFMDFSKYNGGTGDEYSQKKQVVNGETYVVGVTTSVNFPVTDGSTLHGGRDITVTKYSNTGNVIYSKFIGGNGDDLCTLMKVINGEVYLLGTTSSTNYPVTNGSTWGGGYSDLIVTKLNSSGNIVLSTYLGGNKEEDELPFNGGSQLDFQIEGNQIFIIGHTESSNYPVTNGTAASGGEFITVLNNLDGSIIFSEIIFPNVVFSSDEIQKMHVQDGAVYLVGATHLIDLPVNIGNNPQAEPAGYYHEYVIKFNSSNFNVMYSRYISGNSYDFVGNSEVVNGELYLTGYTYSIDFPVTNGTVASSGLNDNDGFFTRLNIDGSIGFSTYLSSDKDDELLWMKVSNGEVFLGGVTAQASTNSLDILIYKLNSNSTIGYSKTLKVYPYPIYPTFEVLNGNLYIAGIGAKSDFTVTNGSQFYDINFTGFYTELGPSGDIVFSTFLGKLKNMLPLQISGNKVYLLGNTDTGIYPATDGSVISGADDNILTVFTPGGTNLFSGYIGGNNDDIPVDLAIDNGDIYLSGYTRSLNYPVTDNILYQGGRDQFLTKLSFCSDRYDVTHDTLSPKVQTVCKYGLLEVITGTEMIVPTDSLPMIYRNGIGSNQPNPLRRATYQWQVAYSLSGPWTDIANAISKDYTPSVGTVDQYYRRLTYSPTDCGNTLIHVSDTASALINSLTAPTINAGGLFHTCPGSAITIGGFPIVTGGNPPYVSYVWDMGAAAVENPTVSPELSTIYSLIVTDALGCKQLGQSVVLVHRAEAGPDKNNCAGAAVKIGTAAIADLPGVIYDWQPGTALSNTTIAQPFANPVIPSDYELTLTVPKSGGGICITKDTVKVIPIAGPITPNMAGPDKVICLGDSAVLGTTAESGFNYYWSPANYLINDQHSIITYYPRPTANMPTPNPATISLIVQKQGCSFIDQVVVATIESRAGLSSYCGPLIIGLPDRTPNINETYSWVKISGPGNFTGATNLPQVPVSASIGVTTVYGLTVSYNDGSCYSQVSVPVCPNSGSGGGTDCFVDIDTIARYHCPGYTANNGDVTLIASSNIVNAVYTWSPHAGLSAYTGNLVQLTDNVPRTYTVTVTDANDPSVYCSNEIFVNDPLFVAPIFPAPDTATCINIPVPIGLPTVTGYTYEWTGTGLSNYFISNPVATVASSIAYPIKVKNGTGCELSDTVLVVLQNAQVNAGQDWVVCSNGIAKLGASAQPNTTYLWGPQASPWQNGTTQFSAQPEVLIATNVTFTVTATTSAGCITTDQVNVVVNNSPTIANAPNKTICPGQSVSIGSPALPGVSYQWSPVTGLNNAAIAQPQANPANTTTYTVLATFQGSCVLPATDQVIVTVSNPAFDLPDINFCPSNGPFPLGVGAPTGMAEYFWFPTQMVTNHLIANPSTLNPPPNVPTAFILRVRNSNNCYYYDTIHVIPSIVAPLSGTNRTLCKNALSSIGSTENTGGPGITYSWSPTTNLSDPLNPNPIFTAASAGVFTYILTKTDNNVSCTSKDTIIITVTELVFPAINGPTVCQNSCVQIGTTPVTGIEYHWTPSTGLSDPNIANPLACIDIVTTSYTLTATDMNGCTASANVVVGVNSIPAPQINIPTVIACVGDNNAMFNPVVTPPGSYSYLWSPDNGTLSNINVANPGIIITGTGSTPYTLQVTNDITGCSNTATGNVVVSNCPTLATTGNFVWLDGNEDGLQNPGESGVSGINVKLYNNVGFNLSSVVTDVNGVYHFTDVPPGNDYYAIFQKPAGYTFTTQNVGGIGAGNNSTADITGKSNNFNIVPAANITNIDAGIKLDIIPVTLLNFTAVLHNTEVLLNWQTTAEYNNHYFEVERSTDGISFIAIGRLNGNGTTSLPHSYSLTDPNPVSGINYYRLKQVDLDGHKNYSYVRTIRLSKNETVFTYYNDQNNSIQVSFNKQQNNVLLMLYGTNGQLIRSVVAGNNITSYRFELPVLPTGIYMFRVMSDKLTLTKKFFINNR